MKFAVRQNRFLASASPWVLIGAAVVLLPIVTMMTVTNLNRQKELTTRLMVEKGAALIRSFEAGTRTGMMGMHAGAFKLERLLVETAQQPDIVHLLVTDAEGNVVAHNDPKRVGSRYGEGLPLDRVADSPRLNYRRLEFADGTKVFEVFRRFRPVEDRPGIRMRHMMPGRGMMPGIDLNFGLAAPPQVIFVGFDMAPVEKARLADIRHAVIMGAIWLLVGLAGITLLFFLQSYRATRVTLARIKAFSDTVVENLPIGLVAIDGQGRVAAFNQAAEAVFGRRAGQVAGRPADEVLPAALLSLIEAAAAAGRSLEREIDCPVGPARTVPLEVGASVLHDEDGRRQGGILLFKDLTEVRALRSEIARSQRLATVGRLAAGVAHEIRNPLSSIKGFATYFRERYREVPEDQQTASIMIQEVDRLNRVVTQLLEFARPVAIRPQAVAIGRLLEDSLKLVEEQAARGGVELKLEGAAGLPPVMLDPDRLSQVLLNLYLNALDAMEDGGTLSVRAAMDGEGMLEVSVADTGRGIPEAEMAHIFDPYFTTKPTGTGLGLAIAHNIVTAAGGEILVDSRPGHGTRFRVRLPAAPAAAATDPEAGHTPAGAATD